MEKFLQQKVHRRLHYSLNKMEIGTETIFSDYRLSMQAQYDAHLEGASRTCIQAINRDLAINRDD